MNAKHICTTCNTPLVVRPELLIKPASGGKFVLCQNVHCYDLCPINDNSGGSFWQKAVREPEPVLT